MAEANGYGDKPLAADSTNGECSREGNECMTSDEIEQKHFAEIVTTFRYYKRHALSQIRDKVTTFSHLPPAHKKLLNPSFPSHLKKLRDCAMTNAALIPLILQDIGQMFENSDHDGDLQDSELIRAASEFNMEKLQSTLRQIVRDWSAEGAPERAATYGPVIGALRDEFPDASTDVRISCPGSGLGRLPWELARLGYTAQGNEFSLFMLFVSNFILNRSLAAEDFVVHPFIHQSCNVVSYEDAVRGVRFPDVDPNSLPKPGNGLSMAAGDFLDVYADEDGEWDAIASVFFLDTARNPIDYIQRIHAMLKPGGIWVNFGPLLYHFSDVEGSESLELPWTELRRLIGQLGFAMEREEHDHATTYTQNARSLLQHTYRCIFFVARKLEASTSQDEAKEEEAPPKEKEETK